jgi:hypothetical protein
LLTKLELSLRDTLDRVILLIDRNAYVNVSGFKIQVLPVAMHSVLFNESENFQQIIFRILSKAKPGLQHMKRIFHQ